MLKRTQNNLASTNGQVRIIGGQWRSRKLNFPAAEGLRPTGDRMREMLFNWLQPYVYGARALDLFAGSGALGLEALSRGAAHVDFFELDRAAAKALEQNLALLRCEVARVFQADAVQSMPRGGGAYDMVFIDPPFQLGLQQRCCELLVQRDLLAPNALVYVEQPKDVPALNLPLNWNLLKHKALGNVNALLYQVV